MVTSAITIAKRPAATKIHQPVGDFQFAFDIFGHALFVDDPDKFNRVLDDFLKSAPQ